MIIATSLLQELLEEQPHLRSQMYFKSSLTALSHAMEDQVLASEDAPIVIACFQRERFYRQEASRYLRISDKSDQVYVLAAPETDFSSQSGAYETIAFEPTDSLSNEWHLVVLGQSYSLCLICHEHKEVVERSAAQQIPHMDQSRRFEGIWTFDRAVCCRATQLLLQRILQYRPELKKKINLALASIKGEVETRFHTVDPAPFADRLVTYLQAGQYKQNKAYRQIAAKERKERLVNSISTAIRRSLDPNQVLSVAVQELGQTLGSDRCIIYQCSAEDEAAIIEYEFKIPKLPSLINQSWNFSDNPWFTEISQEQDCLFIENIRDNEKVLTSPSFLRQISRADIHALLMVPVIHQKTLIGMIELHQCQADTRQRHDDDIAVIEAIAAQVGVALIQAQAYADLEVLNEQLANLERTRSNLIAITGHELRTPLSTIQVCLESLAFEPDMAEELREVMLSTALSDAERMRKLVQDFLTLSRLESGRVDWHSEAISLDECINLALSSISIRQGEDPYAEISVNLPEDIPFIKADGEWLVEVLVKLVDNACKFSAPDDHIKISAQVIDQRLMQISVSDTGRGIESDQLENIFERFYQEEGALRRTTGGTGLGLAICRQIIHNMGGKIWADSPGKEKGSTFSFTVPLASE